MFTLLFFLFVNFWIWKIFFYNIWLFLIIILITILSYLRLDKKKNFINALLFVFVFLLLFFQYKTTNTSSLTGLTNDQIRVRDMRLKEYPPLYVKVANYILWIPGAHWLEGRRESITARRISENVGDTLDINQYFFASHPRQRVGVKEFEKFPYILIPLFFVGITWLVKERKKSFLTLFFLVPILTMSLMGNNNSIGAFSLIPFIAVSLNKGAQEILLHVRKYTNIDKTFLVSAFLIIYVLVFVQMISYESFIF